MNAIVKLTLISIFLYSYVCLQAQDSELKKYDYYLSLGAGLSILNNVPSAIYQETHSNYQIGIFGERNLNEKYSLLTGIELERAIYSFDGAIFPSNGELEISIAPDGMKYTKLYTFTIGVPVHGRYYFKPNLNDQTNVFLQGGIRFNIAGSTDFEFRENNEVFEEPLSEFHNNFSLQLELMIGFKGDFFDKLAILNSSSLGVIYQAQPIFESGTNLRPIHFTWRFLF